MTTEYDEYDGKLLLWRLEQELRVALDQAAKPRMGKWRGKHCSCSGQPCIRHCPKQTAPCDCTWWQAYPAAEELVAVDSPDGLVDPVDGIPVTPDPEQVIAPAPARILNKTGEPAKDSCPHGLKRRLYCSICVRVDAKALAKETQSQGLAQALAAVMKTLEGGTG